MILVVDIRLQAIEDKNQIQRKKNLQAQGNKRHSYV